MSTQGQKRNKIDALNLYSIRNDKGMRKIIKKEKENEKKKKAISQSVDTEWTTRRSGVWRNYYWIRGNNEEMNGWGE